jgi:hypothetical protein
MKTKGMIALVLAFTLAHCGEAPGPSACPPIDGSAGKGWWAGDAGGAGACVYPCALGYRPWPRPTVDGGRVYGRCYWYGL